MKGGVGAGATECGCIEQSLSTGLDSGSIEKSLSTGLPSSSLCRRVSHYTSYSNACQYVGVLVESLSNILISNSDLTASMPACGTLQNSKFLRKSCSFNCVQHSRLWWMGAGGRRWAQEGEEGDRREKRHVLRRLLSMHAPVCQLSRHSGGGSVTQS